MDKVSHLAQGQVDMYRVRCYEGFAGLPAAHRSLVDSARRDDLFSDPAWFDHVMTHFYPGAHQVRVYALEADNGKPLLLMPLRACQIDYSAFGAQTLGSISHPENYSTVAMIFSPEARDHEGLLIQLLKHFRRGGGDAPGLPVELLRLWPVDTVGDDGRMLHRALGKAGFWTQVYANSYNRYEDTAGLGYEAYFAQRSANLRYSVRRRQRALEKSGHLELALYKGTDGLDEAIEDYYAVSLGSWKEAESMVSDDMIAMIRLAAESGCMRLGILRFNGVPAAAQFWIVTGGVGHCSRLAYHDDFKQQAVGVVLTNFMIYHVLEDDHVSRIDFGYGEEDYKGGWMKEARDYYGFLAFNPRTRQGLLHGLKNILGRPVKRLAKAVLVMLRLRQPETAEPVRGRAASGNGVVDR
jgi:hypothetical protein